MSADRIQVEVSDQFGIVAEIMDPAVLDRLSPRKRAKLEALAAEALQDVVAITGSDERHARQLIVATLMRMIADQKAYERVCQQNGLLL